MKTTKNINGIYDNGNWKIRDNGEVIAEGCGVDSYIKAKEESNKVGSFLKINLKNSIILGPTVCSVFKVNNLYRFNIIIKYKKEDDLYKTLNYLQEHYKSINNVDIDIDFNPINI